MCVNNCSLTRTEFLLYGKLVLYNFLLCVGNALGGTMYWASGLHIYGPLPFRSGQHIYFLILNSISYTGTVVCTTVYYDSCLRVSIIPFVGLFLILDEMRPSTGFQKLLNIVKYIGTGTLKKPYKQSAPLKITKRFQQCCGSGMCYHGSRTRIRPFSHPFRSKVLVLVIVKKIRNPGSGKNSSRIQGVKTYRIPDPDP
jgi:hypothetical protein